MKEKIDSDKPKSIHKVRIAFKKFRYACELMTDVLWLSEDEVGKMKAFQKRLWKIQDTEVSIKYIKSSENKEKLKDMKKYLEKRRKKQILKLLGNLEYIDEYAKGIKVTKE